VVKLRAEAVSRWLKPGDAGWLEAVRRGGGTAGIEWRRGGDGIDMRGLTCQWQGREEAVWQKAQLRKENILPRIRQGVQADSAGKGQGGLRGTGGPSWRTRSAGLDLREDSRRH
jgi:hypothetical protein